MDIRVLQYFLAVAWEESITGAAEALHVSQPNLSRQIKELEEELGAKLFLRGNRKVTLTQEGVLLRKRAGELIDLFEKTRSEFRETKEIVSAIFISGPERRRRSSCWHRRPRRSRPPNSDIPSAVFTIAVTRMRLFLWKTATTSKRYRRIQSMRQRHLPLTYTSYH